MKNVNATLGKNGIFRRFLFGAIPILLLGSLAWFAVFHHYFREQSRLIEIRRQSQYILNQAIELSEEENGFLHDDVVNPRFYEPNGEGDHQREHRKHAVMGREAIADVMKIAPERQAELTLLQEKLSRYTLLFDKMTSRYQERGFRETGLEGRWRSSLTHFREELKPYMVRSGKVAGFFWSTATAEFDYIYQDDRALVTHVHDGMDSLARELGSARKSAAVLSALSEHRALFDQYVKAEEEIGLNESEGIRKDLKDVFDSIEEQAGALIKDANARATAAIGRLTWVCGGLMLLMVILEIAALYRLARSVTLPIEALSLAVTRFRGGETSVEIPRSSLQEVDALSAAFGEMLANLSKTQGQLFQAQKLEAIGTLAGGIAHDFNNLLGGILAYAGILKKRLHEDRQTVNEIEIIEKSAERGAELTKQLLGYARKGSYERKKFSLNEVTLEARKLLYRTIDKTITIKADLAEGLEMIEGDSGQILQALMNLGINARDAMPEGGELWFESQNMDVDELFSRTHGSLKPGRYVRISISDTGTGIPKELQNKIFDPFFTTKEVGKGTGLGLSMVYGIMENHKGVVTVYSEVGKGTCFHLYFPATTNAAVQPNEAAKPLDLPTNRSSRLLGQMILSVDDEMLMRNLTKDVLEPEGATLFFATNGEEALEFLQKNHSVLNLIVLDVIMPKMDGIKVYKELRKFAPTIPVVFASGYAESEAITKLREDGNVDFIQKPFRAETLVHAVLKNVFRDREEKRAG